MSKPTSGLISGYSHQKKPLAGYAALAALFTVGLVTAFAAAERNDEEAMPQLGWSDLVLLGIATHKLSRIVAKDLVTSPFRAPFVEFKKYAGDGEVEEEARGEGLQEAVGDLISCPYCMAPWIGSAFVFAFGWKPRMTRVLASIFSITAASDFLNRAYAATKD